MKILIVMDPGILIPVKGYGGHERLVEMFAKEYRAMGHEVSLLITSRSYVEGCTVFDFGKEGFPPAKTDALKAIPHAWKFLWKHRHEFDLIHNFGRLAYLLPIMHHPVKKIMTYGREITSSNIRMINTIGSRNLVFTACSANLLSRVKAKENWEVVYNAIEFEKYRLEASVPEDAPLIFLGRIEKVKGCHTAIAVARATGKKLVIAGNISPLPEEQLYYEKEIAPYVDGEQIQYVGTVNDAQKNEWLGRASALLFPIEWNEPFGIVMIEAMACGTPVIAFQRGSVDEVVTEGITGFKVPDAGGMIAAVMKINNVSRSECRAYAKNRFNVHIIARQYLHIVDESRPSAVILTTHQPTANPRALKEYETLKAQGFRLKYLYGYNGEWSQRIDEEKFEKGKLTRQDFVHVGGNPKKHAIRYFFSRLMYHIFRISSPSVGFSKQMSTARVAFPLWRNAARYPADIYLAHYLGALPAACKAAKRHNALLVFDAEDFHRGEKSYYRGQMRNVETVENDLLREADLITTASPLISKEYQKLFPAKRIVTIRNVFSKSFAVDPKPAESRLKLFWFSQNIGEHRGLEIFIQALNLLPDEDICLTIMGKSPSTNYQEELLKMSNRPDIITFRGTAPAEETFSIAALHDIGMAGETPDCYNKEICLSNKIFTYLLAGNALLASDMEGQRLFMEENPGLGFVYRHNDPTDLADKIKCLYENRELLQVFKNNAFKLASQELNWEKEELSWLQGVQGLLSRKLSINNAQQTRLVPVVEN